MSDKDKKYTVEDVFSIFRRLEHYFALLAQHDSSLSRDQRLTLVNGTAFLEDDCCGARWWETWRYGGSEVHHYEFDLAEALCDDPLAAIKVRSDEWNEAQTRREELRKAVELDRLKAVELQERQEFERLSAKFAGEQKA